MVATIRKKSWETMVLSVNSTPRWIVTYDLSAWNISFFHIIKQSDDNSHIFLKKKKNDFDEKSLAQSLLTWPSMVVAITSKRYFLAIKSAARRKISLRSWSDCFSQSARALKLEAMAFLIISCQQQIDSTHKCTEHSI